MVRRPSAWIEPGLDAGMQQDRPFRLQPGAQGLLEAGCIIDRPGFAIAAGQCHGREIDPGGHPSLAAGAVMHAVVEQHMQQAAPMEARLPSFISAAPSLSSTTTHRGTVRATPSAMPAAPPLEPTWYRCSGR